MIKSEKYLKDLGHYKIKTMTELLILDYNRPKELKTLLESLKKYANFDKKVVVLNNGGERYADEYLESGLCDKVINNKINVGCGLGSIQLFSQCESEFAFYLQCDHELICFINEESVDIFKKMINSGEYFYVDLAGDQGHGVYSDRAHFIKREDFLLINKQGGGVGPLSDLKWTEEDIQDHMRENGLKFYSVYGYLPSGTNPIAPFLDCGKESVRENSDGSQWRHRCDTKELWLIKGPVKEKSDYPKFTEEEWKLVLETQSWPDGQIPEKEKEHSFRVPQWG